MVSQERRRKVSPVSEGRVEAIGLFDEDACVQLGRLRVSPDRVEREGTVEVGDSQLNVIDVYAGIDRLGHPPIIAHSPSKVYASDLTRATRAPANIDSGASASAIRSPA